MYILLRVLFIDLNNCNNKSQMPEGPEVLTITGMMNFYMSGKIISDINFLCGKNKEDKPEGYVSFIKALPLKVDKVFCKGKLIVMQFSNPENKSEKIWILNHLVMTGSWQLNVKNTDKKYIRCRMEFDETPSYGALDITSIDFIDVRDLGKFDFIFNEYTLNDILCKLESGFIGDYIIDFYTFKKNIEECKRANLITKLRDQKSICSGIGNYLISEIMYDAGLSYVLKCNELSERMIKKLYDSCKSIITLSYTRGGLSIENYVDIYGDKGTFEPYLKVYRKDGKGGRGNTDPYGNKVYSIKKGQTLWYVPGLQRKDDYE